MSSLTQSRRRGGVILLLLLALQIFPLARATAGHIVGGEFTYEFVGYENNDILNGRLLYDVVINMYRDCIEPPPGQRPDAWFDGGGAPPPETGVQAAPSDMHITIYRANGVAVAETFMTELTSWRYVPLNLGNPCLRTEEEICQQVGRYEFRVILPAIDETYTLVYTRCCRPDVTNVFVPPFPDDALGIAYFAQITPLAQRRTNSSPVFRSDPPIAFCIDEEFRIDLGATDKDGDSLAYKFCPMRLGAGLNCFRGYPCDPRDPTTTVAPLVDAAPPYRAVRFKRPLFTPEKPLGLTSTLEIDSVGELRGIPKFSGNFSFAVCIEEWTRGPNPVLLSETKREMQINVVECAVTVDADLLETEIDEQGRFFIRGCGLGEQEIINESTDQEDIESYFWEIQGPNGPINGFNRNFRLGSIDQPGVYPGTMIINRESISERCRDTADFLLGVYPESYPDFEFDRAVCDATPLQFENLSTTDATRIDTFQWNFGDSTAGSLASAPRHLFRRPGLFPVTLRIVDNNQCDWTMTKEVDYRPAPRTIILEPDAAFGCAPYEKAFVNRSRPIDDSYTFDWDFGDGTGSAERDPTHVYEEGVYDVSLRITSPVGCEVDSVFRQLVDVRGAPVADFSFSPEQPTFSQRTVTVTDRSDGAANQRFFVYDFAGNLISAYPRDGFSVRLRELDSVLVTQYVTHPSGCIDSLSRVLRLGTENDVVVPNAFSPNGDGLNDVFLPVGNFFRVTEYRLRIWNQWGERIFVSTDPTQGWDGRIRGSDSPGGGYLWDLSYVDFNGNQRVSKGGVVLLR